MLRTIVIAGATLVFVGAFASTGSAATIDPSAASKAALAAFSAASDAQPLVISKRTGTTTTRPTPSRPHPGSSGTRRSKSISR